MIWTGCGNSNRRPPPKSARNADTSPVSSARFATALSRFGQQCNADEVQVAGFNRFRTFRDGMLNIPDRVAAMLAAESDPMKVHATLTAEIRKALLEFSDGSNR